VICGLERSLPGGGSGQYVGVLAGLYGICPLGISAFADHDGHSLLAASVAFDIGSMLYILSWSEPIKDSRMFMLWVEVGGIRGDGLDPGMQSFSAVRFGVLGRFPSTSLCRHHWWSLDCWWGQIRDGVGGEEVALQGMRFTVVLGADR
jgi:hypothetical protein